MGNTIWIQVQQGGEKTGGERDLSVMLEFQETLDQLANSLGVTPPSAFFDYTAIAQQFLEDQKEAGEEPMEEMSPEVWSDASDGHRTIAALASSLRDNSSALGGAQDALPKDRLDWLLEEFDHCVSLLERAEREGNPFRFLVVP